LSVDAGFGDKAGHFSNPALKRLFAPLKGEDRLALAVSGGSDSMALMALAARWRVLVRRPATSIIVLTVDHGLRAESARREAESVKQAALRLGFGHAALRWEGPKPATGVQEAAREARYRLMTGYCAEHGIDALVTAHTRDDQAETFLLRLARGSGVDGLSAMAPERRLGPCRLLRPLLGISRQRLRAYLIREDIGWFDDPSNENPAFERVRMRRALRAFAAMGVNAASIARSAARLREAREALDAVALAFMAAHVNFQPEGYALLNARALRLQPKAIAMRVLARILGSIGGAARPAALSQIESLANALASPRSPAVTLGGCIVRKDGRSIAFYREPGRLGPCKIEIAPGETRLWDGRFALSLGKSARGCVTVAALGEEGWRAIAPTLRGAREHGAPLPPRLAAIATPAAFEGDVLLAAPVPGWLRPGFEDAPASHLSARFEP
jgi:tRNA(Ile)-lysidine synthase